MSKRESFNRNIDIRNIGDLCTEVVQIYGANVKFMRQIPSVVDGLKPVDRRSLYAMYLEKATHDRPFHKSSSLVGKTLNYHPHGDTPVYETIVKLSQIWNNIMPLVQMDGNNGTPMGDPPAAHRYTKARLSKYAYKCFFEEFDLALVNTKESYKGDEVEPEFLPSRYPNVLINNTFGIGYGVSSGLPTYNIREVLELTIKLLEDPEYPDITLIPDSPTWADVIDEGNFKELSETGEGRFRMRGEMTVDEANNTLSIRSTPLHVYYNGVEAAILDLQDKGKLGGIIDFKLYGKNKTNSPTEFEVKIILKKEIDPYVIREAIFASNKTRMQRTIPVNFKLIDDYEDIDFNIRSLILTWIDYRREFKRRLYNHKIIKARERQHILEKILLIFTGSNGEKALKTIKDAENKNEIIKYLMKSFPISSLQAEQIADMRLSAFSKDSIRRYKDEKEKIDETVEKLDKIIRSSKRIDKIIREELEEGIHMFGTDRRSRIITVEGESKVRDTSHIMVFTLDGLIKKLPHDIANIGTINQGDYPIEILADVSNLTDLLIFDEKGNVFKLPVQDVRNSELGSGGESLERYCKISGKITAIIRKPEPESLEKIKMPVYLVMTTRNGLIKKTLVNRYTNIKSELLALIIKEDDQLISVKMMAGDKDILVYTNKGFGVRFPSDAIKETKRMSIGVKALDMTDGEFVVGMDIINPKDTQIFSLTNKGTGKKSTLDNFQSMDRASKPLRIISLEDDEEVILIKTVKGKEKFNVYMKNSIEIIDIEDVVELPRLSKGKKLLPVSKGNMIIDIKEIK